MDVPRDQPASDRSRLIDGDMPEAQRRGRHAFGDGRFRMQIVVRMIVGMIDPIGKIGTARATDS